MINSVVCCIFNLHVLWAIIIKLQTPAINYYASKDKIVLRYFTSSTALEYFIDPTQLRIRDPKTGNFWMLGVLYQKLKHKRIYFNT